MAAGAQAEVQTRRRERQRPEEILECYVNRYGEVHKGGCRPGRPLCKARRRSAGQALCECPSYPFPHRLGGGRCGDPEAGGWHRPGKPAKR